MTAEEYKEVVDYIVSTPQKDIGTILKAQQQFINESDKNVLSDILLGCPTVKRLITEDRITEEQLQWLGLALCSILLIGHACDKLIEV